MTGPHAQHPSNPVATTAAKTDSTFEAEMKAGMAHMMQTMHGLGYSGYPDQDFLAMMIPHHQGAIDMARQVLVHGHDPLVRRLAEEMIASQTVEIQGMTRRLEMLRGGLGPRTVTHDVEYPALGATRGSALDVGNR